MIAEANRRTALGEWQAYAASRKIKLMSAVLTPPSQVPPARPARPAVATPARPGSPVNGRPYRFVFEDVEWDFYVQIDDQVGPDVFATFYKGTLELVTLSILHDATSRVLDNLICVLAEETDTPKRSAGTATLRARPLGVGTQGDETYWFGRNVSAIQPRVEAGGLFDFNEDPPPDLAVEVEVTARLGSRIEIYREIGVPEVWRYDGSLTVLVLRDGRYEEADRSPTFPQLSSQEIGGFVAQGLRTDETTLIKRFRRRVQEVLATANAPTPPRG